MGIVIRSSETYTCNTDQLEAFLAGELTVGEETKLVSHLNSCTNCRNVLEQLAANRDFWAEAENLLKAPRDDILFGNGELPSGISKKTNTQPMLIRVVLDALGPTDDPEKLGRIGGYEVTGVVGAGGMGVVLKAVDKSLDRIVAIKVLAPHLATSGAARKRFSREAKAAAAVLHPNVIAIHNVSNDESLPYLVMPYVRGTSLQKRIDKEGPIPLMEILRIGCQIAAGLAAAHAQGLIHRDIKPANILLEEGVERVTITDFGLARAVDDATITQSGVIAGTPQFMSPEQARGEALDQRSDLFSLGSVLYAMSTGRPPFRAETTYGVMRRITDDHPTSIREINSDIPEWFCDIVGKLMSKQASDRYPSASAIAGLLEDCLRHVQQPESVPLPKSVARQKQRGQITRGLTGVIAMLVIASLGLSSLLFLQVAQPPANNERVPPKQIPVEAIHPTLTLSDAISQFNELAAGDRIGKVQPPLTDDEVIASIRSLRDPDKNRDLTESDVEQLKAMSKNRLFAEAWRFEYLTEIGGIDGERFRVWQIQLASKSTEEKKSVHLIRRQFLYQMDADGNPVSLPRSESSELGDAMPLAAAIKAFNSRYHSIGDLSLGESQQEPLTENEVIAAIRWWKSRRDDAPVSNRAFADFQKIADTRQLPRGSELELISNFRRGQGDTQVIWSVRIRMPNGVQDGWTYAFGVRNQYIRSELFEDLQIAWGPNAVNGLQAGVRLEPRKTEYDVGERMTPIFYIRNTRDVTTDINIPRLITYHSTKIYVGDSTGKGIPIEHADPHQGIPTGWVTSALSPEDHCDIRGLPILFGKGELRNGETAIRVEEGQEIRLRFELPNFKADDVAPLRTGELTFAIRKRPPGERRLRRTMDKFNSEDKTKVALSDHEKAVAKLVLVFFQDISRRAVPCLVLNVKGKAYAMTTGPATINPDGTPHAIDQMFVEIPTGPPVEVTHDRRSTHGLYVCRMPDNTESLHLTEVASVNNGDKVTALTSNKNGVNEGMVTGIGLPATFELPDRNLTHKYERLIEVNQRFIEGTPLFLNGKLVGLTLLGTRYIPKGLNKSYVVPASQILEQCEILGREE